MNKKELVEKIAANAGTTRSVAEGVLNATIQEITAALKTGDSVQLVGFGTFSTRDRAPRVGRNPRTKEPIQISASKAPVFSAGKTLKDAVK